MEFFLDGEHVRLLDRIHGAYLLRSYLHADSLSVASLLNKEIHTNITLCVSQGSKGYLTPLAVDLPCNNEPIAITVLITGSPAALACGTQMLMQHRGIREEDYWQEHQGSPLQK